MIVLEKICERLKMIKEISMRIIICTFIGCIAAIFSSFTLATVWVSLLTSKKVMFQIQKHAKENIYLFNFASNELFDCHLQFNPHEVVLESIEKAIPREDSINLLINNNAFRFNTHSLLGKNSYQAQQIKLNVQNKTENVSEVVLQCKVGATPFEVIDKRVDVLRDQRALDVSQTLSNHKPAVSHLSLVERKKAPSVVRPLPPLPIKLSHQSSANSEFSLLEQLKEFEQRLTSPSNSLVEKRRYLDVLHSLLPLFDSIKSKGANLEKLCQGLNLSKGKSTFAQGTTVMVDEKELLENEGLRTLCAQSGVSHTTQASFPVKESQEPASKKILDINDLKEPHSHGKFIEISPVTTTTPVHELTSTHRPPIFTVLPGEALGSSGTIDDKKNTAASEMENTVFLKAPSSRKHDKVVSTTMQALHEREGIQDLKQAEELLKDPKRSNLLAQLRKRDQGNDESNTSRENSLSQQIEQREKERKEFEAKRKLEQEEKARKELVEAQERARPKMQLMHSELLRKLQFIGTPQSPVKSSKPPATLAEERIRELKELRDAVSSGQIKANEKVSDLSKRRSLSRMLSQAEPEDIVERFSNKEKQDEFRDAVVVAPSMMDSIIIEEAVHRQEGLVCKESNKNEEA